MILGRLALSDLVEIELYTRRYWGVSQADEYEKFLLSCVVGLEGGELLGKQIKNSPGKYYYLAKWPRAEHGHYLIYEWVEGEIALLSVIHSAMNFPVSD